jgi:hypothetical protein
MSNFFGGVIPTFPVSTNGAVNGLTNNIVQTLGGTVINVAVNQATPDEWKQTLGVSAASFDSILPSLQRNALSSGEQFFSQFLSTGLSTPGVGILGKIGINLAQNATSNIIQNLLGDISGAAVSSGWSGRWFPGASNEPVANYGGSSYSSGRNGPDVIFSIIPAVTGAAREAIGVFDSKSKISLAIGDTFVNTSGTKSSFSQFNKTQLFSKRVSNALSQNFDKLKIEGFTAPTAPGDLDFYKFLSLDQGEVPPEDYLSGSDFRSTFLPEGWNFICAPDSISWNSEAQVERIPVFGTNQPPVISGSKSMRDLTLSEALVEGFSRGRSVESKIAKLENLMNFTLDTKNKYVKVPVYFVRANDKLYGGGLNGDDGGYFVIKSVNVKELMRDLSGSATRALVDVSFVQVPPYQIDSGRDIANVALLGRKSVLPAVADAVTNLMQKADSLVKGSPAAGTPSKIPLADSMDPLPQQRVGQ